MKWKTTEREKRKIAGGDTADGEISFGGLAPGWYTIYESSPPEGYKVDKKERFTEIQIGVEGETLKLEHKKKIINEFNRKLKIQKVDPKHPEVKQKNVPFTVQFIELDSDYVSKFKAEYGYNPNTYKVFVDSKGKYSLTEKDILTGNDGTVTIKGLWPGTYLIKEGDNPNGVYNKVSKKITIKNENYTETKVSTIENEEIELGKITILKKDSKGEKVKGAGFSIKFVDFLDDPKFSKSKAKSEGITIEEGMYLTKANCKYSNKKKIFETDDVGNITVSAIWPGVYEIYEEHCGLGSKNNHVKKRVTVTRDRNRGVLVVDAEDPDNQIIPSSADIVKIDADTGEPIKDVVFEIERTEIDSEYKEDWIEHQNALKRQDPTYQIKDFDKEHPAFKITKTTNKKGEINLDTLIPGKYKVTEIQNNNQYYYDENVNYTKTVTAPYLGARQKDDGFGKTTRGYKVQAIFTNQKKYIDLEGYVWENIIQAGKQEGEASSHDNVYNQGDVLVQGIPVTLYKENTKIGTEITDANGHYIFDCDKYKKQIAINDLNKYYIEFTYNGITYQSLPAMTDIISNGKAKVIIPNGNTASDSSKRDAFNDKFYTIEKDKSYTGQGKEGANMTYTRTGNVSTLKFGNNPLTYTTVNGVKRDVPIGGEGLDSQYAINARTTRSVGETFGSSAQTIRDTGLKTITGLNLGLYLRAKPDINIEKELSAVKVSLNDKTYYYDNNNRKVRDKAGNVPQVKYGRDDPDLTPYTRAFYPSDISYIRDKNEGTTEKDGAVDNTKPAVSIFYEIIVNGDTTYPVVINKLNDYYDDKFTFVQAGNKLEGGVLTETFKTSQGNETHTVKKAVPGGGTQDVTYNTRVLEPNLKVEAGKRKTIYVELKVKPDKMATSLFDSNSKDPFILSNITEVASYSILTQDGKKAFGGVDKNSQPNNLFDTVRNGEEINAKEDFEDDTFRAPGIQLELQANRTISGNVFEDYPEYSALSGFNKDKINSEQERLGNGQLDKNEPGINGVTVHLLENGKEATCYGEDGKTASATINTDKDGNYTINGFIPGNYTVQFEWDGKAMGRKDINVQEYKGTIYQNKDRQNDKEWHKKDVDKQYSDAIDNMQIRKQIDAQYTTQSTGGPNEADEITAGKKEDIYNGNNVRTTMLSSTPEFSVEVESDGGINLGTLTVKYDIKNIDFGIIERPKQQLEMNKEVASATIQLANGSILSKIEIENGEPKNSSKYVTYMPKAGLSRKQVKFEVDSEIIQGAKLIIDYKITVGNVSEKDYLEEDYYKYGTGGTTLVKLKASEIAEYLNNSIEIQDEEGLTMYADDTLNSYLDNRILYAYTTGADVIDNTLQEKKEEFINKYKKIIKYTNDEINLELEPGETKSIGLTTTRLLSSSVEELSIEENEVEIIKVQQSGGRPVTPIPGNYIPTELVNRDQNPTEESDDTQSESVIITPPTGLEFDYIAYTLIAISGLGVLGLGIVLIRKFVIKNNKK